VWARGGVQGSLKMHNEVVELQEYDNTENISDKE